MSDCNGCGYCCLKTPCEAAHRVYGPGIAVCPALTWTGERHICQLMELPSGLGERFRAELHAGAGCCCGLNSWRQDVRNRIPAKKLTKEARIPSIMQLFLACLGRQWIGGDAIMLALYAFQAELVDSGMDEAEAEAIVGKCLHYLKDHRKGSLDDFLGGL